MTLNTYLEEHETDIYKDYETEKEMVQIFNTYLDNGTDKTVAIIAENSFDGRMILKEMGIYDSEWDNEITLNEAKELGLEII